VTAEYQDGNEATVAELAAKYLPLLRAVDPVPTSTSDGGLRVGVVP
jgi:hypothetical protein